jgi:hypothetical protein
VILLSGGSSESGEPVGAVNILGDPVGSWRATGESYHTSDWVGGLPVTERAKARCLLGLDTVKWPEAMLHRRVGYVGPRHGYAVLG